MTATKGVFKKMCSFTAKFIPFFQCEMCSFLLLNSSHFFQCESIS